MSLRAHVDGENGQLHQILGHHVVEDRGDPVHGQGGISQPQDPVERSIQEGFSRLTDALCKLLVAHGETLDLQGGGGSVPSPWASPRHIVQSRAPQRALTATWSDPMIPVRLPVPYWMEKGVPITW